MEHWILIKGIFNWFYWSWNNLDWILLVESLLLPHGRSRWSLLHLITHNNIHTHTRGRTPLDNKSVHRRGLCLYNTEQSQDNNIHAHGGIRNRIPSKRAAADLCLTPYAHRDLNFYACKKTCHKLLRGQSRFPITVMAPCESCILPSDSNTGIMCSNSTSC
jgi:hypothetical protein